jgi:hypothetical protein
MTDIFYNNKSELNTLLLEELTKLITIKNEFPITSLVIGSFDNCREYGNTYSIKDSNFTYCIYEHRNSDSIIINGCKNQDIKPYGPYKGDKWDYLESFNYGQIQETVNKLYEYLYIDSHKEKQ